jgi:hypothetical protein
MILKLEQEIEKIKKIFEEYPSLNEEKEEEEKDPKIKSC